MDARTITTIIIVVGVIVWIAWDIIVATNKRKDDTISEIIRDYTFLPILPASLGVVTGHWTLLGMKITGDAGFWFLICISCMLALWSLLVKEEVIKGKLVGLHLWVGKRPYIPFIIGYILGGFLWGLEPIES